jgi:hypothetical protein
MPIKPRIRVEAPPIFILVRLAVGDRIINEIEPNGTFTLADFLPQNGTTFRGTNSSKSDVDVFRVNVPSNVRLTIVFSPEFNLDLEYYLIGLYNSSDTLIAAAIRSGDSLVLNHQINLAGNYYLRVFYDNESPYSRGDSYTGYVYWE